MKCSELRHQLAQLEQVTRPTRELRSHLGQCSACRAWYRKLVRIEQKVLALPTPESNGKGAFVQKVLSGVVPGNNRPSTHPVWQTTGRTYPSSRDRGQQKLALATALAAGLLLFAVTFGALQGYKPVDSRQARPSETLTSILMKPYSNLGPKATPRERILVLSNVADDLHRQSHSLARLSNTKDLELLATFYQQVLRQHLLEQAQKLSREERSSILGPIASNLDTIGDETVGIAAEMEGSSAESLRVIAAIARETSLQLKGYI